MVRESLTRAAPAPRQALMRHPPNASTVTDRPLRGSWIVPENGVLNRALVSPAEGASGPSTGRNSGCGRGLSRDRRRHTRSGHGLHSRRIRGQRGRGDLGDARDSYLAGRIPSGHSVRCGTACTSSHRHDQPLRGYVSALGDCLGLGKPRARAAPVVAMERGRRVARLVGHLMWPR